MGDRGLRTGTKAAHPHAHNLPLDPAGPVLVVEEEFITVADVCTLMMQMGYAGWETYNVVSEQCLSPWNREANRAIDASRKAVERS